jgi:hypothetical protein
MFLAPILCSGYFHNSSTEDGDQDREDGWLVFLALLFDNALHEILKSADPFSGR